ncbi:SRPBCC domain-containing protein [Staphylococcus sp. ACRSN]|uniref:SRPBCC family protein n=1 Tax=Staphylococcus sp. ACRSN TaxID=2918214 RepID=UPI001EF2E1A6|nr:SRPBCC domain-containing protein [Staphylococcus sp. ACRSN]MCG7338134.1 SRPBCC domain-containing protein [Staphylococcus sp. ACRSN]
MSIKVDNNKIIFTRTFNTTVENVFKSYTDEQLFKSWFHPEGGSTEIFKFDVRGGGDAFFAIHTSEGTSYTVTKYNKVVAPSTIDYFDYFADSEGNINKNMAGMHNIINLNQINKDETEIESVSVLPDAQSAQDLLNMGVEAGMNSTFDNLEKLIVTL